MITAQVNELPPPRRHIPRPPPGRPREAPDHPPVAAQPVW